MVWGCYFVVVIMVMVYALWPVLVAKYMAILKKTHWPSTRLSSAFLGDRQPPPLPLRLAASASWFGKSYWRLEGWFLIYLTEVSGSMTGLRWTNGRRLSGSSGRRKRPNIGDNTSAWSPNLFTTLLPVLVFALYLKLPYCPQSFSIHYCHLVFVALR